MNFEKVMRMTGQWGGTLKFFPSDSEARIGIAEEVSRFVSTENQLDWLVRRVNRIYRDWPGVLEIRAVFCTKFSPLDGQQAIFGTSSPAYDVLDPEVLEARENALRLTARPAMRQLTGDVAASPKVESIFAVIAEARARKSAPAVDPAETERIKAEQESQRNPDAVAELARKLGIA